MPGSGARYRPTAAQGALLRALVEIQREAQSPFPASLCISPPQSRNYHQGYCKQGIAKKELQGRRWKQGIMTQALASKELQARWVFPSASLEGSLPSPCCFSLFRIILSNQNA